MSNHLFSWPRRPVQGRPRALRPLPGAHSLSYKAFGMKTFYAAPFPCFQPSSPCLQRHSHSNNTICLQHHSHSNNTIAMATALLIQGPTRAQKRRNKKHNCRSLCGFLCDIIMYPNGVLLLDGNCRVTVEWTAIFSRLHLYCRRVIGFQQEWLMRLRQTQSEPLSAGYRKLLVMLFE